MFLFFSRRRADRAAASRIYTATVEQARTPVFFRDWGVADTLDGRFEMIVLHLFAVTDRLVDAADGDPRLARFLAEAFIKDMDAAFREMGVGDLTVPKRIKTLYRSFGGRLKAYRDGRKAGQATLVDAIERNVFPDGDPRHGSLSLAEYLEASLRSLASTPLQLLRSGSLPFASLDVSPEVTSR